ncbi:MAG TPA: hypothetical protein VM912_15795, partial [Terriglobales bacterium]|nr:hypothetical protein [Terriglobales bacterium]
MESLEELLVRPARARVTRGISVAARQYSASRALYAFSIFLGAFLLFQIELIIGKYLLPWFGGSAAVWTTCMLFFQILLVGGYAYAHLLGTRLQERRQTSLHIALLFLAFCAMLVLATKWPSPITPETSWKPDPTGNPAWQIAALLAIAVGIPFFVLSSTGPLIQQWFSRSFGRNSPYRLYSLSNIGSLLGLLSYPFLFERFLRIRSQAWIWSILFALLLVSLGSIAVLRLKVNPARNNFDGDIELSLPMRSDEIQKAGLLRFFQWGAFAACGSAMLLATTNLMCQEVAVVPLLWVLPLSLYLLSFVICFDNDRWCRRELFQALFLVSAILALSKAVWNQDRSITLQVAFLSMAHFSVCLVCHAELAHLKPRSRNLTSFYLSLGIGGAVGGTFVAVIAPLIFHTFAEFYVCLLACSAIIAVSLLVEKNSWLHRCPSWTPWVGLLIAAFLPGSGLLVPTPLWLLVPYSPIYRVIGILIGVATLWAVVKRKQSPARPAWMCISILSVVGVISYAGYDDVNFGLDRTSWRIRNFYGVKEVDRAGGQLSLINGRTVHGTQWISRARRDEPTSYYDRASGVGRLIQDYPRHRTNHAANLRIGVIGLGVGTLAAYGRAGDYFRFYEIDPAVIDLSLGEAPRF